MNDFSAFAVDPIEGQVGSYWYHEGTQAYFDDLGHYKMIKAMCSLSCTVCDKKDEQQNAGQRREQSLGTLSSLRVTCLTGIDCLSALCVWKVFICEQKLYGREQLAQYIKTGNPVVDGTENEKGGFTGHPMCEFCQNPFCGENELYLHMPTEHFTCRICQRRHPVQYEYYRNYDDMEIHFRQKHPLCENEVWHAKKFVVFASEFELKGHITEHGGRMSCSKRNASLQIPINF